MAHSTAARRLQVLHRILQTPKSPLLNFVQKTSSDATKVTLGDISKEIVQPKCVPYIPHLYFKDMSSQAWLKNLRWMMQKDLLGQDVFLIGSPGPLRRNLALSYLELTRREFEYITLTRDTTDSDLKQRREIKDGTSFYHDQAAVRAAIEGRVLILEGVEKAERNVLPVLNNLLENREMQLEDGRMLIPASRYDKLLQSHSKEELDNFKLVRVSEKFRVIALGIPCPPYQGHPLDPPLRSRFQARDISNIPFKDHVEELYEEFPEVPKDVISRSLSLGHTLCSEESKGLGLPDFPVQNLDKLLHIINLVPVEQMDNIIQRIYPFSVFLPKDGQKAAVEAFTSFNFQPNNLSRGREAELLEVIPDPGVESEAEVKINVSGHVLSNKVACGNSFSIITSESSKEFVSNPYHRGFISDLLLSHLVGDFCVIGPRGCGKSVAILRLAELLGYQVEPILLYQDMTSRDLVQQRVTNSKGDTSWQFSPLIVAALNGKMALLDGIHRLHHGTLAVLHRLLHDREIQLYDGKRLLRSDRYDHIKTETGKTDDEMASMGVYRIHPSFRVVGLAEPPQIGAPKGQWLNAESLSLFLYHNMRPLNRSEIGDLITQKIGSNLRGLDELLTVVERLASSSDPVLVSLAQSLSLRQVIRIAKRRNAYPEFDLHSAVYKACLARFLPSLAKQALDNTLTNCGVKKPIQPKTEASPLCEINKDGILVIGNTSIPIYQPETSSKVPDTLFFNINQHVRVLESMLQDWLLGDHLLLIGNQGVGKNKLADRFLYLLNRSREYIQLHRDTTVQSLTIQPTVKEGRIEYEDSPLVNAVKNGHVLVIDEADKAPTHVTCVLKTLVEIGEMLLSDGRRIVPARHPLALRKDPSVIVTHPDFRMIVLANRPGFPFLGNDFFGALGDLFSCHAIDNPSVESEIALLKEYGPDVSEKIMRQLVGAFGELRDLADQGLIQYPYSTREVVNVIKHLQKYQDDGVASVVRNVFDFDSWSGEAKETVIKVMHKYGIPVGASAGNVSLAKRFPLPDPVLASTWRIQKAKSPTPPRELPVDTSSISYKGPFVVSVYEDYLSPSENRSSVFTEQQNFWSLPIYDTCIVSGIASNYAADSSGKEQYGVHVATLSPFALYSIYPQFGPSLLRSILLHDVVTIRRGLSAQVKVNIACLPNDILAIHEETTQNFMLLRPSTGEIWPIQLDSYFQSIKQSFSDFTETETTRFSMSKHLANEGLVFLWELGGSRVKMFDITSGSLHSVTLPFKLNSFIPLNRKEFLLTDDLDHKFLLKGDDGFPNVLYSVSEDGDTEFSFTNASTPVSDFILSSSLKQKISSPSTLLSPSNDYAAIAVGFPELDLSDNELYLWQRNDTFESSSRSDDPSDLVCVLPEAGQIVRVIEKLPEKVRKDLNIVKHSRYLEITDLVSRGLFYLPIPQASTTPMWNFLARDRVNEVFLCQHGQDGVASVDSAGGLRLWETGSIRLETALSEWRKMVGYQDSPLRMEIERESGKDVTSPKHGKEDPGNDPHVGGNTWAGGTGGRDTAGLGGKGGPYRLDAGHDVHQIPDWEKEQVPEEVKRAAREMGQKAFKERLREIQMSEYDASLYEKLAGNVRPQIRSLRNIVSSLQAKTKERQWLRHRTDGELDDLKLIEGLAGERNVYRQRREEEPEVGAPQTKPKRLRLVVDVSGSMYRFNGHDGRLERELEATLMVMEAFEGFENKFKYDIYGHSGEEFAEPLVRVDNIPKNNKERLDVLKTMQAHAQFCISGDNTLEAARNATKTLSQEDSDESFVILLSDANLDRYGISPRELNNALNAESSVNSYAIFIGSLGDQADRLRKALPAGRSFVCLDLAQLPQILQQVFTSAVLT